MINMLSCHYLLTLDMGLLKRVWNMFTWSILKSNIITQCWHCSCASKKFQQPSSTWVVDPLICLAFLLKHGLHPNLYLYLIVFLAHPSRRLKWATATAFRPSYVVRRAYTFYIFIFFSRTSGRILIKLGGDHPWGIGTQSCSWGACGPQGAQGEGPQGKKGGKL